MWTVSIHDLFCFVIQFIIFIHDNYSSFHWYSLTFLDQLRYFKMACVCCVRRLFVSMRYKIWCVWWLTESQKRRHIDASCGCMVLWFTWFILIIISFINECTSIQSSTARWKPLVPFTTWCGAVRHVFSGHWSMDQWLLHSPAFKILCFFKVCWNVTKCHTRWTILILICWCCSKEFTYLDLNP